MQILAHRGFWRTTDEKNSEIAIRRAFEAGYGIETDVRDQDGKLVISHDPPTGSVMGFDRFLDIYLASPSRSRLALNVKADGLQNALKASLVDAGVENYVMFDMSVPDLLGYRRAAMPFYVRRSEFEGASALDGDAAGVWLDSFERPYADAAAIAEAAVAVGGEIAFVSPELHGKAHHEAWGVWKGVSAEYPGRLLLCTDVPDDAEAFFNRT